MHSRGDSQQCPADSDARRIDLGPSPAAVGLVALAQRGLELGQADAVADELRRRAEVGRRERLRDASAQSLVHEAARVGV